MPVKVVYIISDVNKALAFEWIAAYINKDIVSLSFILLNPGETVLENYLIQNGFDVFRVQCRSKKDWFSAIVKTSKLLKRIKPDIVHCHLLQANIIGLISAKLTGVKTRIYTRHHSSQHHIYHPKGVVWDKLVNKMATHIIAISGIVKKILVEWEKVPVEKVQLIPHGFLLEEFFEINDERGQAFEAKYGLQDRFPVVGVISRFTELKGVHYIIPAFQKIIRQYPNALLLLLNANGDYEEVIHNQLKSLPEHSYRLISFERDIAAAYKSMDIFIHVPIDEHSEAFGQIYIESLAAGVPAIFTRSGIANEPYFTEKVAVWVDYKNAEQIHEAILEILRNNENTKERITVGKSIARKFDLASYIQKLESLYTHS